MTGPSAAAGAAEPTAPARSRFRRVFELALGAAILLLVIRFGAGVGWRNLWDRAREAEPLLLAAAVLVLLVRAWSWHLRWTLVLAPLDEGTPGPRRFAILQAAALANHVVPSMRLAGGLLRARYLSRGGRLGFAQAYGTVIFDMAVHHATSFAVSWLALVAGCWLIGRRWTAATLLAGGLLAVVWLTRRLRRGQPLDGVLVRYLRRQLQGAGERLPGLRAHGREAGSVLRRLLAVRALRVQLPLLSCVWFAATVAEQWIVFYALDAPVGFWTVAAAAAMGTVAAAVTGVPGGAGPTEGAMVATFMAFGVGRVDALTATLLARGIHYGVVAALGLPSLLYCTLGPTGARERDPLAPAAAPATRPLGAGSPPDPAP